eukprot:175884-Alexandrium_andersonii.AAC.2
MPYALTTACLCVPIVQCKCAGARAHLLTHALLTRAQHAEYRATAYCHPGQSTWHERTRVLEHPQAHPDHQVSGLWARHGAIRSECA